MMKKYPVSEKLSKRHGVLSRQFHYVCVNGPKSSLYTVFIIVEHGYLK